jgi:hypothetical protein
MGLKYPVLVCRDSILLAQEISLGSILVLNLVHKVMLYDFLSWLWDWERNSFLLAD